MNSDILEGNWKQIKGRLQEVRGWLIRDQLRVIKGRRVQSAGAIQVAYGVIRSKDLRTNRKAQPPLSQAGALGMWNNGE